MKTRLAILVALLVVTQAYSQEIKNVDFVSPMHENMAAVQLGASWGFITAQGDLKIPLRKDLVISSSTSEKMPYPYFSKGRAIFTEVRDDIVYYGYLNLLGDVVIPAKYIQVTPFAEHGKALALELFKQKLGENDILKKPMVRYVYNEVVIDTTGKVICYLTEPQHILPMKDKMKKSPEITSYFISPTLVAVKNKKGSWDIVDSTIN